MATEDPILELITSAIPVADDGCCMIEVRSDGTSLWGHPSTLAALIRDKLTESGRLLPSGGEVRTQWGVRWHAVPEQDEWDDWGFLDEAHAREEMASSPTPYTLLRRRTITLPVEPVVSDNSEVPDAD